jgi:hypothetical protein
MCVYTYRMYSSNGVFCVRGVLVVVVVITPRTVSDFHFGPQPRHRRQAASDFIGQRPRRSIDVSKANHRNRQRVITFGKGSAVTAVGTAGDSFQLRRGANEPRPVFPAASRSAGYRQLDCRLCRHPLSSLEAKCLRSSRRKGVWSREARRTLHRQAAARDALTLSRGSGSHFAPRLCRNG